MGKNDITNDTLISKPNTRAFEENFDRIFGKKTCAHELYKTGDPDCPSAILDRNGEVVLSFCRKCRKGECELTES